jgi:type VI secretion system protein ImpK
MTDRFTTIMVPLLNKVLDVVDLPRSRNDLTRDEAIDAFSAVLEQSRTEGIRAFGRDAMEAIEFGVIALIDDLMVESTWGASVGWATDVNCLEYHLRTTNRRGDKFFDIAEDALEQSRNVEIVLVYLVCVALGFRGEYRDKPEELKRWAHRAREFVEMNLRPLPPPYEKDEFARNEGLRPLNEPRMLVRAGLMSSLSILLTLLAYFRSVYVSLN